MIECCDSHFWLVLWGFVIAFILAFGIGANDVANSFGTSVGSKVLTLKQACILATIFEILGSILIGAKVSGTIRKGILDPNEFAGTEVELMLGYVSALSGCCVWLIIATILNLPVSGTHSIVGATIGMAIVSKGIKVIKWFEIGKIVMSWFISPILSGVVSLLLFIVIRKFILRAPSPLKAGLRYLPLIYTITIAVNIGGIVESSPPLLGFDKIPWWGKVIMVIGLSIIIYLSIWLILAPFMKKKIEKTLALAESQDDSEKEKLQEINQNSEEKKTISTQVDYVALIMARNEDAKVQEKYEQEEKPTQKKDDSFHRASLSSDVLTKLKNNRTRLISAPSSMPKDLSDIGDVNLTLRGYLHTIHHSPAARNQATTRSQKTGSVSSNPGESSLKKIFVQPDQKEVPAEAKSETKRGRFNIGKVDGAAQPTSLTTSEKSLAKGSSMLEIDADVEENISELPQKKQKVVKLDDFSHSDPPEAAKLFSFLQVLTAIFGSFAHGGNDVSNAIGPLIGLYLIYQEGNIVDKANTPEWILFYGGVGISVGLWVLGRRVIKTIGEDLTKITASSGFVIEIASAMTVLGASLLNIPVSTTHCKVGSVVFTGRVRSKQSVDWSLFRNIIIAWIVTVPVTGSIAAAVQFCLLSIYRVKA